MRKTVLMMFLAGVALGVTARADEAFDVLKSQYDETMTLWRAQRDAARADDGSGDESKLPPPPAEAFLPRFKDFAEQHAGTAEAIPALAWIITQGVSCLPSDADKSPGTWAVEQLARDHAADPALGEHLRRMRWAYYDLERGPLIALYERIASENKDSTAVAWATFNQAFTLYRTAVESADEASPTEKDHAEKLFRKTATEFAGTEPAERAAGYIYEIENLQIGMRAPDIVGLDTDGKEVRLSQFRGRVVVLDFWGLW